MAKRKSQAKPAVDKDKARVELRFDPDLYEKVKRLADEADVSVNQLLQGIARWATKYGHAGEVTKKDDALIYDEKTPGCLWFGVRGDPIESVEPMLFFSLDFTGRHVVKEHEKDEFVY